MEIENGVIINGEFHEAINVNDNPAFTCDDCSLKSICYTLTDSLCEAFIGYNGFIHRGTITELKVEEKQ